MVVDLGRGYMAQISAVDIVINQVRSWIMDNTYKSGDKLPSEGEICAICQVSRGPVREAMKVLSTIGLVHVRQGDGTYISDDEASTSTINPLKLTLQKSYHSSKELVELRGFIEKDIAEMIISKADDEDLDELKLCNLELEKAVLQGSKVETMVELDMNFHKKMGAITHNVLMSIIYSNILDFIKEDTYRLYVQSSDMGPLSVKMHDNICKALKSRNLDRVVNEIQIAMQNHVMDVGTARSEYEKFEESMVDR